MNVDQWYFSKDDLLDTPTILHGRSFEEEQLDRIKGCHYLLAVGAKLSLPQIVVVTATTFFHRFYMRQSMTRYHVYDIAATCLFISTKVEEGTRRMKEIVLACAQKASKDDNLKLEEDSKEFLRWKESMLYNELIVLETLCFDLSVEHPHTSLLLFETRFNVSATSIRRAWMLMYQSLGAPLCVLYKPNVIAAAALLLATNLGGDRSDDHWYENLMEVDIVQVHELAAEMLEYFMDHYLVKSTSSQANSPYPSQQIQHSH